MTSDCIPDEAICASNAALVVRVIRSERGHPDRLGVTHLIEQRVEVSVRDRLLDLVPVRPLHARAASDNAGSLRVLLKAGFKIIGTEKP